MLNDGMIQIEETKDPTNVCRALHENHPLYEPLVGEGIKRQADKWSLNGLPEKYTFFNVLSNQEPVGFQAIKSLSADTLYLVGLYFNREAQGKGFGTTLIRRLKKDAIAKGFKKIVLLAHEEASWALGFYEKNGFRAVTTDRDQMVDYIPEIEPYCLSNTLLMVMDLTPQAFGMTQVGSSGVNADAYWIDEVSGLYVVADGASGAHDKQLASRCCVETFESLKGQLSQMAPEDFLKRCFTEVNRRLMEQSQKDGAVSFTTLSAVLHFENFLFVLSVGDSPIYGVTSEGLQTLSKPIKRYSKLIELGILTEEEIIASIEQLKPELRSAFEIFLPAIVLPLQVTTYWAKDYTHLILCTDGLSDHLSDQEWLRITDEKASLKQTVEAYIQRVEEKCATTNTDDMTAILVSL